MTYRATDGDANTTAQDSDTLSFTVTVVADSAPRFTATVADQTYTEGSAIRSRLLPGARGGNGVRTYRLTPGVPGLRFDPRTRRLSGTPTRAGTYRMTYRATDGDANTTAQDSDTLSFTVTVVADSAPRFTATVADQTYTEGSAIRSRLLPGARGGNGVRTYRLTPGVPGLRFDPRTRRLSGTPTRAGTYRMTYRATDGDANTTAQDSDTLSFTVTVVADSAPRFTATVADQTYTEGSAIRSRLLPGARGGNGVRTYRLTPGVPGLRFDPRTRRLSGTPTRAGTYRMTYRATDGDANTTAQDSDTLSFTVTVVADSAPRFTATVANQTYTEGSAIRSRLLPGARGGNGVRTYRLTPEVPGLDFDAATRRLNGTPTRAGTYRMTYRVTDGDANTTAQDSDTLSFTITVVADGAPRFTAAVADQTYTEGSAIRVQVLPGATGGNGVRTYRLTPGVPGLRFDPRTRRLSGTPTRAGAYRMTYRVTDGDANTTAQDSHSLTFTIHVVDVDEPIVDETGACMYEVLGVRLCIDIPGGGEGELDACREGSGTVVETCPAEASLSPTCAVNSDTRFTLHVYGIAPEIAGPLLDGYRQGCENDGGRLQ